MKNNAQAANYDATNAATFNAAMSSAGSGDSITIKTTNYNLTASPIVNHIIHFIGDTPTRTIGTYSGTTSSVNYHFVFNTASSGSTISNLTIKRLIAGAIDTPAEQGGAILNTSGVDLTITNVTLDTNNAKSGGAIYNDGGIINLDSGNKVQNNATMQTVGGGGAIYNTNSGEISIGTNNTFTNNTATVNNTDNGGAIYNADGTIVIGTGNTFSGNKAGKDGGAIYNAADGAVNIGANNTFSGNTANTISTDGNGGAIYNDGGTLTIGAGNTFGGTTVALGNKASQYGGAIYTKNALTIATDNNIFANNAVTSTTLAGAGGAIYIDNGNLTISGTNNTFYANLANASATGMGGAIYSNLGNVNVGTGNTFGGATAALGNRAGQYGGAIYLNDGDLTIGNSNNFLNNVVSSTTQTGAGGAIYLNDGNLIIGDSNIFSANSVTSTTQIGSGGAIYVNGGDITIGTNNTFSANLANTFAGSMGGAIYSNGGDITLNTGNIFTGNVAKQFGGAIYNNGGDLTVGANNTFGGTTVALGNKAAYGGAIYNNNGIVDIAAGADFSNNQAVGSARSGGAIFNTGADGVINITGTSTDTVKFTSNLGGSTMGDKTVDYDQAGGAISNLNTNTTDPTFISLNIDYAEFTSNKAGAGGAIYNAGRMLIDHSLFVANAADGGDGGAIRNAATGIATIQNTIFRDTDTAATLTARYGGIISNSGKMYISNAKFLNNRTTKNIWGMSVLNTGFGKNYDYEFPGAYVEITDSEFTNNATGTAGGASAYNGDGGTMKISSTTFTSNTAQYAGAYGNEAIAYSTGNTYNFNGATSQGGAIWSSAESAIGVKDMIFDSKDDYFEGNFAPKGGALYYDIKNSGTPNSGGPPGTEFPETQTVTIDNGTFKDNYATSATGQGGAIYAELVVGSGQARVNPMYRRLTSTITNSSFTGNYAGKDGGAFYNLASYEGTSTTTIQDSTFTGNQVTFATGAAVNGGAIYNSASNALAVLTMNLDNVDFDDNSAYLDRTVATTGTAASSITTSGGVLYNTATGTSQNATVNINGGTYENNYASSNLVNTGTGTGATTSAAYGGVIYNTTSGIVNIDGATFENNSATANSTANAAVTANARGGVIYNTGGSSKVTIGNSIFTSNKAEATASNSGVGAVTEYAYGGAIYNTSNGVLELTAGNTFLGNSAIINTAGKISYGGAIASDSNIANTKIVDITDNTFEQNSAIYGGAIYLIATNTTATHEISGSTFGGATTTDGNTAEQGGAIYTAAVTTINDASVFENNSAAGSATNASHGGAIFSTKELTINNVTFKSNTADNFGGAIYSTSTAATQSITDATFTTNTASSGGAIYGSVGSVGNTTFTGNIANTTTGGQGGAVYVNGATTFNAGNTFTGNKAQGTSGQGGAIYNAYNGLTITDNTFTSNESTGDGGAIFNNNTMTITSGTFSNNKAGTGTAGNGGAIFNNTSRTLNLNSNDGDIIFSGNTAASAITATNTTGANDIHNAGVALNVHGTANSVILNSGITGTGAINKQNDGILVINANADTYTGILTETGGRVVFGTTLFNSDMNINGGTLELATGSDFNGSRKIKLGVNATLDVSTANDNLTLSANNLASGTGGYGTVTKTGSGTLTIGTGFTAAFVNKFIQSAGETVLATGSTMFNRTADILGGTFTLQDNAILQANTAFAIGQNGTVNLAQDNAYTISTPGKFIGYDDGSTTTYGTITKTGLGDLTVAGDNSGFLGTFVQTTGNTYVNASSRFFGGDNLIKAGIIDITTDSVNYEVTLGSAADSTTAQLFHRANSGTIQNLVGSNTGFQFDGAGSTATFTKSAAVTGMANYTLVNKIDNGSANNVVFESAKVGFSTTDYSGATKYIFNDSIVNLANDTIQETTFGQFETSNSQLWLDMKFELDAGVVKVTSDKLTVTNPSATTQVIGLGTVRLIEDQDNGLGDIYRIKVLNGGAGNKLIFNATDTATISTTAYEYEVKAWDTDKSYLELMVDREADEYSLNKMNKLDGTRGFNFSFINSSTGTYTYNIGESLDPMADGKFTVQGIDTDPTLSILSGRLKDDSGNGSFFNMVNDTDFYLMHLSVEDAKITGNGSVLRMDNADATAHILDTHIYNNQSSDNGGTIYNNLGHLSIVDSFIHDNTSSGGNGGAVYNNDRLDITSDTIGTSINSNTALSGGAIYNNGAALIYADNDFAIELNDNLASNYGGAIYNTATGTNKFDIVAELGNVSINGNTAGNDGGAIYNSGDMNLVASGSTHTLDISNNTATTSRGGAVYNSGNLNLSTYSDGKITFDSNVSNSNDNDIYNDGGNIYVNGSSGDVVINSGIAGTGLIEKTNNGRFVINADSSDYTGTFNQKGGTTVFTDEFFGGTTNVTGGKLELATGGSLATSSLIKLASGGLFDISTANNITLSSTQLVKGADNTYGNLIKTGAGVMTISGDFSGYTSDFLQTAGKTVVSASDKIFGGTSYVRGGELEITGDSIYYTAAASSSASPASTGKITHLSNTTNNINIDNTHIGFEVGATGANIVFDKASSITKAKYTLQNDIYNGNANTVTFKNADLYLGIAAYTGTGTTYALSNVNLDLRNSANQATSFGNLTTDSASKVSFDIGFDGTSVLASDTLSTGTNNSNTIGIGQIAVVSDNDNGLNTSYSKKVLTNLTFNTNSDTTTVSSAIYNYTIGVDTSDRSKLTLTATSFKDANSLNAMNIKPNTRAFDFGVYGNGTVNPTPVVYTVGADLDPTAAGTFDVLGRDADNTLSVISGNDQYSFFNIGDLTNLTIKDLTIQNASGSTGSVIYSNYSGSQTTLQNVAMNDNTATADGGAIFNGHGVVTINSGSFSGNTAGDSGGAIFNDDELYLTADASKTITFSNNVDSNGANDIFNTGATTIDGLGTVTINSGFGGNGTIVKDNAGILNLNGDSSSFAGTFTQDDGTTNVGGKFFGGTSVINDGEVNFNNGSSFEDIGEIVQIETDAVVNINTTGTNNFTVNGQFQGDGTINKDANGVFTLKGDNSSFTGTFEQTDGTTVVAGKIFNTTNNFIDGTVELTNGADLSPTNAVIALGEDAVMNITNTTSPVALDASKLTGYNDGVNPVTYGDINKTGSGTLNLSGDNSSFGGTFTQTNGTTVLAQGAKVFGDAAAQNLIQGGEFQAVVGTNAQLNLPVTLNGGDLTYKSTLPSTSKLTVNNTNLSNVVVASTGTTITFGSNTSSQVSYELGTEINKGTNTTIAFDNSKVTFGTNTYSGTTKYSFNDSVIDLSSAGGSINTTTFGDLAISGNTSLNLDVRFDKTDPDQPVEVQADKLKTTGTAQTIDLGTIRFHDVYDDGTSQDTSVTVLDGLTFSSAKTVNYATTIHKYIVSTNTALDGLDITYDGISSNHSLYEMNDLEGLRVFAFSDYDDGLPHTYNIDQSLGVTKAGDFQVLGWDSDASLSIISGKINGGSTKGSFFKLDNETDLTIEDVTIRDAEGTSGSVINITNADATATLNNVILTENTATTGDGGAIYNGAGTVTVLNTTFDSNTAANGGGGAIATGTGSTTTVINTTFDSNEAEYGGAIYNDYGTVNITGATFDSNEATNGGGAIYNYGTTTVNGGTSFTNNTTTTNGGGAIYNDGTLNLSSTTGNITFSGNTAATAADGNDIYNTGTVNINGGANDVIINGGIAGIGDINKSGGGRLVLNGDSSYYTGDFTQSGGTTEVNTKFFEGASEVTGGTLNVNSGGSINDGTLDIDGGVLNWIGTAAKGADAELTVNSGNLNVVSNSTLNLNNANDKIEKDAVVNLTNGSTINNTLGEVTFSLLDQLNGTLNNDNVVTFDGFGKDFRTGTGTYNQTDAAAETNIVNGSNIELGSKADISAGTINIGSSTQTSSSRLGVGAGSEIDTAVDVNLLDDNLLDVHGGTVTLDSGDNWEGQINLSDGQLNLNNVPNDGIIAATGGELNLNSGTLTVQDGGGINGAVETNLAAGTNLNIDTNGAVVLDDSDTWDGTVNLTDGRLILADMTNDGTVSTLNQTGGSLELVNGTEISLGNGNNFSITGGGVLIDNSSTMFLNPGAVFSNANLTLNGGTVNSINNTSGETYNLGTLTINGTANFGVDIDGAAGTNDIFSFTDIQGPGTINVSQYGLMTFPTQSVITLTIFESTAPIPTDVTFGSTASDVVTPQGNYRLVSIGNGQYQLQFLRNTLAGATMRSQVATLSAYNNQLTVNNVLFDHVYLDSEVVQAQKRNGNKYAATIPQFAPYQYSSEGGSLWFKNYVTFEKLSMSQGLNVNNNAYGTIVGADFDVKTLKDGWKFLPTAYIGYNGGHQTFDGVSMYQNGGQGGFMGTFMKGDFITSILAYAGGYQNEMSVGGTTDTTGNWFAGTAAKAAYNFHPSRNLILQPTLLASYNIFGNQNFYSNFGQVGMTSGLLNGVNIAPGFNIIYGRETWSVYGTAQYMYYINDQVSGNMGNIKLPNVRMNHGYIEYGVGATKTWKERLMGYFQVTMRNGGRTGVGFQLGFTWKF